MGADWCFWAASRFCLLAEQEKQNGSQKGAEEKGAGFGALYLLRIEAAENRAATGDSSYRIGDTYQEEEAENDHGRISDDPCCFDV
jgi:hypothetical protein